MNPVFQPGFNAAFQMIQNSKSAHTTNALVVKTMPLKSFIVWLDVGHTGVGSMVIFLQKMMPRSIIKRCLLLWRNKSGAPNSPQWFNTGLHWAYGLAGPAQGHNYVDPETGQMKNSVNAYEHPQPHACFIQSVSDDLVNSGGIMDLWVREARIFKYGSGTGSNFSAIRGAGEPLSGGGKVVRTHVLP